MSQNSEYKWEFQRLGGLDQVHLHTSEELLHLSDLDPKLWVALSCPVRGLEFDDRTLELMDEDQDGRIRIPNVLQAVTWLTERLVTPSSMTQGRKALPLDFIRQDTEEGKLLVASARHILRDRGKEDAPALTPIDVAGVREASATMLLNGDGVIPPHKELGEDLNKFIADVIKVKGSVKDAGGEPGITADILQQFMADIQTHADWLREEGEFEAGFALGSNTSDAFEQLQMLKPKIEDYYARCRLVAYDERSSLAVNAPEAILTELGSGILSSTDERMCSLPLAKAAADQPLPLRHGLNPAWSGEIEAFAHDVITPLLGEMESLSEANWLGLQEQFAPYAALAAQRPQSPLAALSKAELTDMLQSDKAARMEELFRQDAASAPEIANMGQVEKLVLYFCNLYHFLMNFVSFCNFYEQSQPLPIFQIGTLYMDGRSCDLCLRVEDIDAHSTSAQKSYLCLAYCTCTREETRETMNLVAAVTAGDAEFLLPGRNGIFIDREGVVWDAVLTKLVENPISIKTAIFAPYRRLGRMISEQVEKFTVEKDTSSASASFAALQNMGSAVTTTNPAAATSSPLSSTAKAPFDISKNVGILAAVGLALGALGTALATIISSVLSLAWWQIPLLIFIVLALISGPSMLLAWLKIRKRTLGPVLDASGWAINSQIPINYTLGCRLTDTAELPSNVSRLLTDPLKDEEGWKKKSLWILLAAFLIGATATGGWLWYKQHKNSDTRATSSVSTSAPSSVSPVPASESAPAAVEAPDATAVQNPGVPAS